MNLVLKVLINVFVIFQCFLSSYGAGKVEIVQPYHPLYVKTGGALNVTCKSDDRRELQWLRQSPITSWRDTVIEPVEGLDWIIRYTVEEPTGLVESNLIKNNMQLFDRGMYICRDNTHLLSYSIWVTTLQIFYSNVTAVAGRSLVIECTLSGFDNNLPAIAYVWGKDGYEVDIHDGRHIPNQLDESPGHINLTVLNPESSDLGRYQCFFILYTNLGTLELSETVFVTGSNLPISGGLRASIDTILSGMLLLHILLYISKRTAYL